MNLEYIDDSGRAMNSKEAFRFLSHKFHGKGSGKLKTEKRFRKVTSPTVSFLPAFLSSCLFLPL